MDVEILALCEAATASANRINILGVFNEVLATKEPILTPPYGLAARIRFDKGEEGSKKIQLAIVDSAKGEPVFSVDLTAEIRSNPDELSANLQIAGATPPLSLPHFGEYAIRLVIDGRLAKSIPLNVKKGTQLGPQPQMVTTP
jgi:hypothetical protein